MELFSQMNNLAPLEYHWLIEQHACFCFRLHLSPRNVCDCKTNKGSYMDNNSKRLKHMHVITLRKIWKTDDIRKRVLTGFLATWFFAASPMRRSVLVNATYEGVVRLPWSLVIISTRCCCVSQIPTQEYVVPRSMPIAVPLNSI